MRVGALACLWHVMAKFVKLTKDCLLGLCQGPAWSIIIRSGAVLFHSSASSGETLAGKIKKTSNISLLT